MADLLTPDQFFGAPQQAPAPTAAPALMSPDDFFGTNKGVPAPAPAQASQIVSVSQDGIPTFADPADNIAMTKSMGDYTSRMAEKGLEGATLGTAPFPEAAIRSIGGGSFQDNLAKARQYTAGTSKQFPGSSAVAEGAGSLIPTVATAGMIPPAASLAGRVGQGLLLGAGSGALSAGGQDVGSGNTATIGSDMLKGGAIGGVTGAAAPAVLGGVARVVSPNVSPDVRTLLDAGVTPTPGQIAGGALNRVEEGAQSIPFVGDAIKAARGRAIGDLNKAAVNDALAPIGQQLDPATPPGREAINEAAGKISSAYSTLVPKLTATADPTFTANVQNLHAMAQSMTPDRATQFNKVLDQQVLSKFSPNGTISGESFKDVESTLGRLASDYRHSAVADERQVGSAFLQLQQEMRDMLTRSNPAVAPALQANNLAYAKLLRVQDASANLGAPNGVFSGAQLLSAVKANDPTLHKAAFARGNAMSQDLAEAGKNVLGNKVPDSGTAFRAANMAALPAMYEGLQHAPGATVGAIGAGGLGYAAYSPVGQKALAALLTSRPAIAPTIAAGLRRASPAVGMGAAIPLASMAAGPP